MSKAKIYALTPEGKRLKNELKELFSRLAELKDKIENGTLIESPYKLGASVYCGKYFEEIVNLTITSATFQLLGDGVYAKFTAEELDTGYTISFDKRDVGRRVFFSREEAEKKLKKLRGEK